MTIVLYEVDSAAFAGFDRDQTLLHSLFEISVYPNYVFVFIRLLLIYCSSYCGNNANAAMLMC